MPLLGHVVAGGADAAVDRVSEVDAGDPRSERDGRLARERAEHFRELERHVERPCGADERTIVGRAGRPPVLGVQAHEPRGGDARQRLGGRDLVGGELARSARQQDRDAADLAVVRDRHEEGGRDVVALDQLGADQLRAARIRHVQAVAGRDHGGDPGRPVGERHPVGLAARGDRLAGRLVLGDLEQVHLVDRRRFEQGVDQLRAEVVWRTGHRRGASDAMQWGQGAVGAGAGGGIEYGVAFPAKGSTGVSAP